MRAAKTAEAATGNNMPRRDRIFVFEVGDCLLLTDLIKGGDQVRHAFADKDESLTEKWRGLPNGIGPPEVVLRPACAEGDSEVVNGRLAVAIESDFSRQRPTGASDLWFDALRPQIGS